MDLDKIRKLRERIKSKKEKLKEETGNPPALNNSAFAKSFHK